MTGARITSTLINSLIYHDEQFGLETMCVGGGQGMALIIERSARSAMSTITYDFSGRTVVVTGGARGIGLEIGRFMRTAGADVVLVDSDATALEQAAADVDAIAVPPTSATRVRWAPRSIQCSLERAGLTSWSTTPESCATACCGRLSDDDWDAVLAVHAGGTFRFTRACVPHFRAQDDGRVINVTSYTGLRGNIGQSNYAMAKAGHHRLHQDRGQGTGPLRRHRQRDLAECRDADDRVHSRRQAGGSRPQIPMGRFAEAWEMAAAVGFLASDEARYITGVVLPVDGGVSI